MAVVATSTVVVLVELPGGIQEKVLVDATLGPLVNSADGTTAPLHINENGNHFNSRGCMDVRQYRKTWPSRSLSEQEQMLQVAAKKNRKLAEWRDAEGGDLSGKCALPDFLANFAPVSWSTEAQQNFFADWTAVAAEAEAGPADMTKPVLAVWYSGGMNKKQGSDSLGDFLDVARKKGITEQVVMHHPEGYDIDGDGSDAWPDFLDRLVEEIDAEPHRRGRPLILWGHSKGATAAMSLASRLGDRVLKVYVVASGAPVPGEVSPFQKLSEEFKKRSDVDLLKWFASMNSDRALHRMIEAVERGELTVESSPFLAGKLSLMRRQYVHTVFPDMERDVQVISAPILAVWPRNDSTSPKEVMEAWRQWTTGDFQLRKVDAGHMDCLQTNEHHDHIAVDMADVVQQHKQQQRH